MRNRMIKKEFWNSERILSISIPERLLFIGMWNIADDEGILKNSPLQLKATIFPVDSHITLGVVEEYVKNMMGVGLIQLNLDETLIKIKKWKDHQRIDKPTPSNHKFIEESIDNSKSVPRIIQEDYTPKERKGIERKGKEIKGKEVVQDKTLELFNSFYSIYKRKQDKKRAYTAFKNLTRKNQILCIEGVNVYNKWLEINNIEKSMIKLPSTYIHSESWMDELDTTVIEQPKKLKFKLDATGKAAIGYCTKCNISDFYDPFTINNLDSRCCNAKLSPEKPTTPNGFVTLDRSIADVMDKYK